MSSGERATGKDDSSLPPKGQKDGQKQKGASEATGGKDVEKLCRR